MLFFISLSIFPSQIHYFFPPMIFIRYFVYSLMIQLYSLTLIYSISNSLSISEVILTRIHTLILCFTATLSVRLTIFGSCLLLCLGHGLIFHLLILLSIASIPSISKILSSFIFASINSSSLRSRMTKDRLVTPS